MKRPDERDREIEALRERLSRLSGASLRINESLDFDTVLQEVADSARALTASRYAAITVLDEAGRLSDFIVSGLTTEEHQGLWDMPEGLWSRPLRETSSRLTPLLECGDCSPPSQSSKTVPSTVPSGPLTCTVGRTFA